MNLSDRTVLITGGAKRIGKNIAIHFAQAGARILLHYFQSGDDAIQTKKEIESSGSACELLQYDLSTPKNAEKFIRTHQKHLQDVSILVNSASVFGATPLDKIDSQKIQKFLDINFLVQAALSQHIGLNIKHRKKEGLIVNLTDARLLSPYPGYSAYFSSKAALDNLTHSLGRELAPYVRVNNIAPGVILFPDDYSEEKKQFITKKIPLQRAGSPDDIANACIFLAEADYVNGITLSIDGALSLT